MPDVQLHLGDCLEFMKTLPDKSVDCVITDPPYPDYYVKEYRYFQPTFLNNFNCRQFVFWSAKVDFPLSYTACHIWDKKTGTGSEYEKIFERNGQYNFKMFRFYFVNSTVAASFTNDIYTGHPSQKPIRLMQKLIREYTNIGDTIFDPFMGSGSTGVAAVQLGRNFIGCEINPDYFSIAQRRIAEAKMQPSMFEEEPYKPKQLEINRYYP